MNIFIKSSKSVAICLACLFILSCIKSVEKAPTEPYQKPETASVNKAQLIGTIKNPMIAECSGMDISPTQENLLWMVNDSGNGPYLFATGLDGRELGRFFIQNAINRDWEDLVTFMWEGISYVLIADFGDNKRRHKTHRFYIVPEPTLPLPSSDDTINIDSSRQIEFSYPDGPHDAEGVAVDCSNGTILVLSKRDSPPILYEVPLFPPDNENTPIIAKKISEVPKIPAPTAEDLLKPFGKYCSHPTAMDISRDGRSLVILTYKNAYLFECLDNQSWRAPLLKKPKQLVLPSAYEHANLRQREAVCFSADDRSILVTSEGIEAGIYRLNLYK